MPDVHEPPRGWKRLAWLGPGFLWMVSAAGSGELLFTPRIGSLYGYALIWALILAVLLKWVVNREIGRFTVCTGQRLLDGFASLPGPRGWALWLILLPQLVVAVASIAGLAGAAATAILLVAPGPLSLWTLLSIGVAGALVLWGKYRSVEWVATGLGIVLAIAAVTAAFAVGPDPNEVASGLKPTLPSEVDHREVLPWLGFMMSGAAGLMWYSYWLHAKGYGSTRSAADPKGLDSAAKTRLRGWIRQMTIDNTIAVVGVLLVTLAFLVLGTELLRPQGLVPAEDEVASVLGRLLGDLWGPVGFWFMVLALFVGFWTTVLTDQDGWGRLFAHGTRRLPGLGTKTERWSEVQLMRAFVVALVIVAPSLLFLAVGEPVALLKVAGAIEAIHIPIVGVLILALNRRLLPRDLQASWPTKALGWAAVAFFGGFAALYVVELVA